MRIKQIGLGAAALASVATLAFAGPASAAAANSVPTTNYQLCGNVYKGTWNSNSAPPSGSGSTGVAGVTITGNLYDPTSATPTVPVFTGTSTATDANGKYCVNANSSLSDVVVNNGGYVELTLNTPTLPTTTPPTTVTSANPWSNAGTTHIGTSTFLAHKHLIWLSAYNFHFTVS
ncbi:hypothetical protein ACFVX3_04745 [Rhodococcus erythropolis]